MRGEDWRVETHEIPAKMRQHLSDTRRISIERDTRPPTVNLGNPKAECSSKTSGDNEFKS